MRDPTLHDLAECRQQIWSSGVPEPAEVFRIGKRLEEEYEQKRSDLAESGSADARKRVRDRARLEEQIERQALK